MNRPVFFILGMLLVVGCTKGPDYVRPPVPDPGGYRGEFPAGESVADTPWWELFSDTVLTNLIAAALVDNRDLRQAMGRVAEARAILGVVRADLFPRVDYSASGTSTITTKEDSDVSNEGAVGLNVSYQLDLWGRIRRATEAAEQELLATEEAYRGVTIAVVASVAAAYFVLRDIDNRLAISERTVKTWRENLDAIETRFRAGIVSEVDVNQAQIQVYEAEVSIQTFERLRAQTENALSVLLGTPPMSIERGLALQDQVLPPELPPGLPSELLQRRPDVLAAERQLHAQTARIGIAEALRYPQLNLLADVGALFNGGSTGFADLAAQMFGPIYNHGAYKRQVEAEKARTDQLMNRYEQTILTAFREVEDALVAVRTYEMEYQSRQRQVAAAENAAKLSWVRYEGGLTSYLEVLDLQRSLFNSQLKASETLQLGLTSIVQLYQALGGGWVAAQDTLGVR